MSITFPDYEQAGRRYSQAFLSILRRSVDTTAFRRLARLGLPHAEANLVRQFTAFVRQLLSGPDFEAYFKDREAALAYFGGVDRMAGTMAANQLATYQRSIDAATVVFAHSALDAAASELCWVTAFSAPDDWDRFVTDRKVSLGEVRDIGFDALRTEKLAAHLRALERESLLKRVDRLFALCKPGADFEGVRGFTFDRDRLERLDDLRQQIVHRDVEDAAFESIEEDVQFLSKSGLHLAAMVNAKYGVQIDVRYALGLQRV